MKERLVGTDWCDCDPCSTLKRHCVLSTCVNHLRCILKSLLTVEYLFSHLTLKAPTIPKKKRYLQNLIFTNLHYLNPTLNSKINSPTWRKVGTPHFPRHPMGSRLRQDGMSHIIEPLTKLYMKYRPGAKIARIFFLKKQLVTKALTHGLSRTPKLDFGQTFWSIFTTVFELIVVSYNFFLSDHVFFFPIPLSGNPLL